MFIIVIGTILVVLGAFGIYSGYSATNWVTSAIAWAALIAGAMTILLGFGKRASVQLEEKPDQNAIDQSHAEVRALIQSMGVVAVADNKVHEQEIRTISRIHEQMLGVSISDVEINEILSEFGPGFDITGRLVANRSKISPTMKRLIVQSCHMVMVSDLEVVQTEESRVHEIGLALGFDQSEIDDLIASAGI